MIVGDGSKEQRRVLQKCYSMRSIRVLSVVVRFLTGRANLDTRELWEHDHGLMVTFDHGYGQRKLTLSCL